MYYVRSWLTVAAVLLAISVRFGGRFDIFSSFSIGSNTMSVSAAQIYPRPDFERTHLLWTSLNGPWNLLFDDEDVGLSARWQSNDLPSQALIARDRVKEESVDTKVTQITQQIAALPEKLLQKNLFASGQGKAFHNKQTINVPFVFQTPASGIQDFGAHEVVWYERTISDIRTETQRQQGYRLVLRFGAVDYEANVWVNGQYVGSHRGGHVPFDMDISDAIITRQTLISSSSSVRLTIRVRDSTYDLTQPRGKQYWGAKPESIFYRPSTGIWQSVWLESVPSVRIADSSHGTIIRSDDIESGEVHAKISVQGRLVAQKYSVELESSFRGITIGKSPKVGLPRAADHVNIDLNMRLSEQHVGELPQHLLKDLPLDDSRCWLNRLALWSPNYPSLYDITLRLYDSMDQLVDEVKTTTGMRSISWTNGDRTFKLNGHTIFQSLVLDQGYWPETGMTPPSADSLKVDIELSKKMGFNGCRKHQKVEDPIFLYWADRLGYLVWGEMANGYEFSDEYVERFNQEWVEAMKRDVNHPCVVVWTPINESWGYPSLKNSIEQRNHIRSLYFITKTLDPSRAINDNCGWEHVQSDLTTFHEYGDASVMANASASINGVLQKKAGRDMFVLPITSAARNDNGSRDQDGAPVLCTECGGINIAAAKGDASAKADDWGYITASDSQDLLKRIEDLIMSIVRSGLVSGFVYTQLADIEQEVNGLYTPDRKEKLDAAKVRAILFEAEKVYLSHHNNGE
ncbi:MAG: hypothetical protein M1822_001974 [Bathelium mastoideum]|nr:MAG: hypothetical protein M1822_001974 [Bathelium mastoideum]